MATSPFRSVPAADIAPELLAGAFSHPVLTVAPGKAQPGTITEYFLTDHFERVDENGVITRISDQASSVAVEVIATTDGLTTGIVPDTASSVNVTSSVNTKLVTMPTPTPGKRVKIFCGANGYNLISSNAAVVGLNAGVGAGKKLAVAAGDVLDCYCSSATNWVITKTSAAGVIATAGAAA